MANYRLSVTLEPMGYGRVETPSLSRALAVELVPALRGAPGPQGSQGPEGPPGPGSSWGGISGALADQTDLQAALADKADTAHSHTAAEISDSSAAGRVLLIATDASAQRAALGAQPLDGDLTALAETTGTNTLYYRSGPDTWSPVTIGSNLSFSGGTLSATGGGLTDGIHEDIEVYGGGANVIVRSASSSPFYINSGFTALSNAFGFNFYGTGFNASWSPGLSNYSLILGGGAILSGLTKALHIGTEGLADSITNITLGSDASGALGTLTINSPTVTFGAQVTSVSMPSALLDAGQVNLQGQGADPAPLTDGRLWHDSANGRLKFHAGGRSKIIDNQLDVPFLVPPSGEYLLTTIGAGGAAAATLTGAAGRLDLFPYITKYDISVDQLLVNCTTAVASAQGKIVVYTSDANGRPDELLLETGALSFASSGVKFEAVSLDLKKGEVYWLGVRHSANATLSSWTTTATPDINGGTSISNSARKVLRRTVTFTDAAPTPWGFNSAEINPGPATAIWMRLA